MQVPLCTSNSPKILLHLHPWHRATDSLATDRVPPHISFVAERIPFRKVVYARLLFASRRLGMRYFERDNVHGRESDVCSVFDRSICSRQAGAFDMMDWWVLRTAGGIRGLVGWLSVSFEVAGR